MLSSLMCFPFRTEILNSDSTDFMAEGDESCENNFGI